MKGVRTWATWWAVGLGCAVAWSAEGDPALKLEPVRVAAIWSNAQVRVIYQRSNDEPRISLLRVESVREKSAAARAGLEKGMEIVAIQGVTLNGLTEDDYQQVMRTPVYAVFVLRVRREGRVKTEELRIAVAK
jgi:C-terminal processing protease CtpA/Prc